MSSSDYRKPAPPSFATLVQSFFAEHLTQQRALSPQTVAAYRDAFVLFLDFAQAHGLGLLSIWAIQRDNGGCPGVIDSNSCSGVKQPAWAFSHLLEPVTGFF